VLAGSGGGLLAFSRRLLSSGVVRHEGRGERNGRERGERGEGSARRCVKGAEIQCIRASTSLVRRVSPLPHLFSRAAAPWKREARKRRRGSAANGRRTVAVRCACRAARRKAASAPDPLSSVPSCCALPLPLLSFAELLPLPPICLPLLRLRPSAVTPPPCTIPCSSRRPCCCAELCTPLFVPSCLAFAFCLPLRSLRLRGALAARETNDSTTARPDPGTGQIKLVLSACLSMGACLVGRLLHKLGSMESAAARAGQWSSGGGGTHVHPCA
jgi:hypothetical protein